MPRLIQKQNSKMCVCVCVCVCKREEQTERKEGREGENEGVQKSIKECKKICIYRCSRDQTANKRFQFYITNLAEVKHNKPMLKN